MTPPANPSDKPAESIVKAGAMSVDVDTATKANPAVSDEEAAAAQSAENDAVTGAEDQSDNSSAADNDSRGAQVKSGSRALRVLAFWVLPTLAVLLTAAAGHLKWQELSGRAAQVAGVESVAAARDGAIAMLSYQPDTVEQDLASARDRLTGAFKDSYTDLTNDLVIPGAKQRHISATATVPAAASVSSTGGHAVVLIFVNQTVIVGQDAPSATASTVRVTLDKAGDRWLISGFDPI